MRMTCRIILIHLALFAGIVGCGKKGSDAASCGATGQGCCASFTCDAGLSCQAGRCEPGTTACGASSQACCSAAPACSGSLACQGGTCLASTPTASKTICTAGGTLTVTGATLTIPSGALTTCRTVKLSRIDDSAPAGYTAYSPIIKIEPDNMTFAVPASLAIEAANAPAAFATLFWSQPTGGIAFAPTPGTFANGRMAADVSLAGQGFVAGADYMRTCAAGQTLSLPGVTLTIPSGVVSVCTMVKLSVVPETPMGYSPYSSVIQIDPAELALAQPVALSLDFTGNADLASMFWSRQGTTGYERISGNAANGVETTQLTRFGKGFVADGVNFVDPPDRSCVVGKMVEGRTMAPSTLALFFTVDDCWGRPLPGLTGSDFSVLENGAAISPAESSATILQQKGIEVFTSIVIDMSASTLPMLSNVITSAKEFVNNLQITKHLPVQIDIQLFAGDALLTEWQAPTLDTATLLAKLDALATYAPADRSSTNLNGAVMDALTRVATAEQVFRTRNYGGAFTIGYLVIFTDGRDTAGRVTHTAAVNAVKASPDQVVAVGLQSSEFDPDALAELAPNGVITAPSSAQLSTAFAAVANRMEGQIHRFYLLGYCSPKRAGSANTVSVSVVGSTSQTTASYTFNAVGFLPGCTAATFSTGCDGKQCGGLGCGACDDRVAGCNQASSLCVNYCGAQGMCAGGSITNAQGYAQSCAPTPDNSSCGAACVDTTTDASNCGGCGIACSAGQRCWNSGCVN